MESEDYNIQNLNYVCTNMGFQCLQELKILTTEWTFEALKENGL